MSVLGRTIKGSFPPSSSVTGVRWTVAAWATYVNETVELGHDLEYGCTYLSSDRLGAYERDVLNVRACRQRFCFFGIAYDELYGVQVGQHIHYGTTPYDCT